MKDEVKVKLGPLQRWLSSFSLDDEELRTGSDATKERSLGSVSLAG